MKRKYLDRLDWTRFIERRYIESYVKNKYFEGYISLLYIDKVDSPYHVVTRKKSYTVLDDGYKWLQFAPNNLNYVATAMIDKDDQLVKWYIDIVKEIGIENGRVFYDDLYLDIGYFPEHEIELLDQDELDEALDNEIIGLKDYELASITMERIVLEIENRDNYIINNYQYYFQKLRIEESVHEFKLYSIT